MFGTSRTVVRSGRGSSDDERKLIFGHFDNEPLNDYGGKLELSSQLMVSYARIREHRKPSEFTKQ